MKNSGRLNFRKDQMTVWRTVDAMVSRQSQNDWNREGPQQVNLCNRSVPQCHLGPVGGNYTTAEQECTEQILSDVYQLSERPEARLCIPSNSVGVATEKHTHET